MSTSNSLERVPRPGLRSAVSPAVAPTRSLSQGAATSRLSANTAAHDDPRLPDATFAASVDFGSPHRPRVRTPATPAVGREPGSDLLQRATQLEAENFGLRRQLAMAAQLADSAQRYADLQASTDATIQQLLRDREPRAPPATSPARSTMSTSPASTAELTMPPAPTAVPTSPAPSTISTSPAPTRTAELTVPPAPTAVPTSPAPAAVPRALGRRPPSNRFKPLDDFPNMVPPPYRRSYASAATVARPAALTSTADHVPDPTHTDLARPPVADDAADTTAVTTADDADNAADTTAAFATYTAELAKHAQLTAGLANMHAQLALLRVQYEARKAELVQRAASMAIRRAQLVRGHRHSNDAPQQGQLTALASVRRKAAHAAESARIDASLPQRFDPPLPARCHLSTCIEAQFGLRSVGEVMTLRGTLARATFRPPRFPQQDPLPKQTEAMRQSKAEAMRQSKARAMRKSKEVQPTCKYATWTRRNQLRLTLA